MPISTLPKFVISITIGRRMFRTFAENDFKNHLSIHSRQTLVEKKWVMIFKTYYLIIPKTIAKPVSPGRLAL